MGSLLLDRLVGCCETDGTAVGLLLGCLEGPQEGARVGARVGWRVGRYEDAMSELVNVYVFTATFETFVVIGSAVA